VIILQLSLFAVVTRVLKPSIRTGQAYLVILYILNNKDLTWPQHLCLFVCYYTQPVSHSGVILKGRIYLTLIDRVNMIAVGRYSRNLLKCFLRGQSSRLIITPNLFAPCLLQDRRPYLFGMHARILKTVVKNGHNIINNHNMLLPITKEPKCINLLLVEFQIQ